jgi:hypothetical protein
MSEGAVMLPFLCRPFVALLFGAFALLRQAWAYAAWSARRSRCLSRKCRSCCSDSAVPARTTEGQCFRWRSSLNYLSLRRSPAVNSSPSFSWCLLLPSTKIADAVAFSSAPSCRRVSTSPASCRGYARHERRSSESELLVRGVVFISRNPEAPTGSFTLPAPEESLRPGREGPVSRLLRWLARRHQPGSLRAARSR